MTTNEVNLDELVQKLYWYTVDHRNIHIKIIVKSLQAKISYGKIRLLIEPIPLDTQLVRIPLKSFWIQLPNLTPLTIEEINKLFKTYNKEIA